MTERASTALIGALNEARLAEKDQTLHYRALAGQAQQAGDGETAERLNGLLADEQHHFSRLTARLVELGAAVPDAPLTEAKPVLAGWEAEARTRELGEIERYRALLSLAADPRTRALLSEILDVERRHERTLSGKWMSA